MLSFDDSMPQKGSQILILSGGKIGNSWFTFGDKSLGVKFFCNIT